MPDFIIIPRGKRILIKLESIGELKTKGGVVLPEQHPENTRVGTIISVGDKVSKELFTGVKIMIAFFSGTVIDLPAQGMTATDDTLRMITEEVIMAILKEEKE